MAKNMFLLTSNYKDEIKAIVRYSFISMLLAKAFKFDTIEYYVDVGNYCWGDHKLVQPLSI